MATVRISQLTAITTPTDDDVLIINDADTNTRKITFANLTQGLLNTSSTPQTKSGALTVNGTLTATGNLVVDTNTFFVDSTSNRVGIKTSTPNVELDIDGTARLRNANSLQFGDANDSNHIAVKAPGVVPANYTLTLPDSAPLVTNLLTVNSAGTMGYSLGIAYNETDDALEAGAVRLVDQGYVRFYEDSGNGTEYIQFNAPSSLSTTNTYTLPSAFPVSTGFVLSSDTSGVLTWVSNSASAAGSPGEIQFNSGGAMGADSDFVWNSGSNTLQTVNVTLTGALIVQGNVDLGDATTDAISIIGRVDTNIEPITSGAHDLGTSALHFAEAHVDDLYVYGNTELGNGTTDAISFNGRVDTDVVPIADNTHDLGTSLIRWAESHVQDSLVYGDLTVDGNVELGDTGTDLISINGVVDTDIIPTGTVDLGSTSAQWGNIFVAGAYVENNVSTSFSRSQAAVVSAASFDVTIGSATVANSAKLIIQVRDVVTGDIEFYEHFVTQDGSGGISEISGANTQAPTPGTFLSTPTTAVVGADVVCSIANTAVSGNNVDIKVQVVATV